jgi:maltooligosyltrehalose synthase
MFNALQKRKENIVEYILYLYQIEDLIRAFEFDILRIEENLVVQYQADGNTKQEILRWYKNLLVMMEKEGVQEKGHLQFLANLINDSNELHLKLMETSINKEYVNEFQAVSGLISELNMKGNEVKNDVQTSLDAVYGFLLLKMQKKEITAETSEAIKRISDWLGFLSKLFKDFEQGELELE